MIKNFQDIELLIIKNQIIILIILLKFKNILLITSRLLRLRSNQKDGVAPRAFVIVGHLPTCT